MYVCGITPYDDSHVGHAMSYIIFDVVRRYLKYRGYGVKCVQNVTDIDDKIITRSNRLGVPAKELADKFTQRYFEDMDNLNVMPADFHPRATEEIPMMLDVIQGLIDQGYAYPAKGSVYFRVRNVPDYGKLSKRSVDAMRTGASVEPGEEKEDPLDFVLWKAAKPGEPSWDSPWGKGRPGWHIECSAMSLRYLGETIDIHGGGQDLVFPHHENEITQSESFTGKKPFVKYWMHNGALQLGAEKMSKSLGNLITIRDALKKYSADAIRIFVLSSYYRSPLTYTEEAIEAANDGAERLLMVASKETVGGRAQILDAKPYYDKFIEGMNDDFNTPKALAILFDLANAINQAGDAGNNIIEAQNTLVSLGRKVMGLKLPRVFNVSVTDGIILRSTVDATVIPGKIIPPEHVPDKVKVNVNRLIEERLNCRKDKKWQRADEIRNKLAELGVILEDSKTVTTVAYKLVPSEEELFNFVKELGLNP
jgi:cysteinyl-tRNA synthetase